MKIIEIRLLTNDLSQTILFYTQTLGFKISHQTSTSISLHAGSSLLTFTANNTLPSPIYHFAFNIPHNQLPEAISWLSNKAALLPVTAESNIAEFKNWNANAVYFTDNNGNLLELIARHDLPNSSDSPFTIAAIECISEIGISVDNVPDYTSKLGLEYFAKQAPMEKFAAIGDDNGLLIFAEVNRNWFPTNIPAAKFPLEVIYENGQLIIPAQ